VTLRTIIDDVLALTAPQAGAKQLAVACGPTVFDGCEIEIFADGERVRQILLNLVMNAIKFTERYGRVRIDCEQTEEDVSVHVVDTGVGIPEAELSRIFEPFVQVGSRDASREGTGLGLPISRNLARAMGGDITVDSREGRGSVFTLTLPRRRRERRRSA
jgi:signal transduction histidine kinase